MGKCAPQERGRCSPSDLLSAGATVSVEFVFRLRKAGLESKLPRLHFVNLETAV